MTQTDTLTVRVREAEPIGRTLKRFRLEAADGGKLPTGAPGAHVLVSVPGPSRVWKNAYSLTSTPEQRAYYEIVVRRVDESRGGSACLHENIRRGDVLTIAAPVNLFPLAATARRHLLIAGGIGLTPMLSYLAALRAGGAPFELHQVCRPDDRAAFESLLEPYAGPNVMVHGTGVREAFDLDALLARQKLGTHVYTCGPRALMHAVTERAHALGWPSGSIHTESFGDHRGGAPFAVVASRSGQRLPVAADQTILEVLEAAGIDAPCLCRGGVCGQCATTVLDGEPEHRDDVLEDGERKGGRVMMICVSRSRTPELTLDI